MKKRILHMPMHIWLCCLLVLTLSTTGITWARYVASANNSDHARVAAFDVSLIPAEDLKISGEDTLEQGNNIGREATSFQVRNGSEVDILYSVEITLNYPLPEGISMSIDGTALTGDSHTISGKALAAGQTSEPHSLEFTSDFTLLTEDYTPTVTINVFAEQAD